MDITEAMQRAVFARLKAYGPLNGVGVYDAVQPTAGFPYVTIFDVQSVEDGDDCHDGDEISFDVHVWSRVVGSVQAKGIAGHVRKALHDFDLPLGEDHALVDLKFTDLRVFRDPDGVTTHGVVSFRALTQSF